MPTALHVRAATAADAEFAYQVLEVTMRGYAEAAWGTWSEADGRARTAADAASGRSQIIQLDTTPIGLLCVDTLPTHLQLDQLYLLPEYQGQGYGAQLLQMTQAQAHALGLPVRLRVLRVNPAQRFYARHGFVVASATPERLFMEWVG